MSGTQITGANYDMRRQARGTEPPVRPKPWRRRLLLGGVTVLALVGCAVGLYGWYTFVHVQTVSARVRAHVRQLAPSVGARLAELYVKEEQTVSKGEVLARLDDSAVRAAVAAVEAAKAIAASGCTQAEANKEMIEAQIAAHIELAKSRVDVAAARVDRAKAEIREREETLQAGIMRAEALRAEAEVILQQFRNGARPEDIDAAGARLNTAQAMLALYEIELKQSQQLVMDGIDSQHILEVRKTRLLTQQNAVREAELELARLEAGPRTEQIEAAAHVLAARDADLALAKARRAEMKGLEADVAIRTSELAEARAVLRQTEARRAEITVAEERVKAARAELARAEAEIAVRRAQLEDMVIISPVNGTVTRVYCDVGEFCRGGSPLILVAEEGKPRWIEGFVDEKDAMLVSEGQKARVRVPAGSRTYVDAVVEQIGLHTVALDNGSAPVTPNTPRHSQPDRVWVRLKPLEAIPQDPITGTTAVAVIRVR